MSIVLVLGASILLQISAAILALRLIHVTGRRRAWTLIALGTSLMAFRRIITMYRLLFESGAHPPDVAAEWVALLISILMTIGIAWIGPLFRRIPESEQEVRASQQMLQAVMGQSREEISVADPEGHYVLVNPAFCALLGYSEEELLAMRVRDLVPQDIDLKLFPNVARGEQGVRETQLQRKDGSRFDAEVSGSPIQLGERRLALGIVRDITERVQAEEALRRHASQLEALRQVGLELAAHLNLDDLLHFIVMRAIELVGGDSGGFYLYRPERDVIEWAIAVGPVLAPIGAVLHRGEGMSGKVWETGQPLIVDDYQRWEGRAAIYRDYPFRAVVGVPIRRGDKFLGVLNVLADSPGAFTPDDVELLELFATPAAIAIHNTRLFERERVYRERAEALRQAAHALGASTELNQTLRIILEQLRRVLTFDTASVLILHDSTPDLVVGLGYADERMTSQAAGRLLQDSPILRRMSQDLQPVISADVRELEGWIWVPGAEHVRSWLAAPLVARDQMIGALMVDDDQVGAYGPEELEIAQALAQHAAQALEHARLFEATQRHAVELEARVAERTDQLREQVAEVEHLNRALSNLLEDLQGANRNLERTTQELAEANERLQELDRLKDEFVSHVSHELRTPLANVKLYLSLLQRGKPEKQAHYIHTLQSETTRLGRLIEDLLDISRLDQAAAVAMEPVNLEALAAEVITTHLPQAEVKQIELVLDVRPDTPLARANAAQIAQVLTNLLGNALAYTPDGGHVTVSLEPGELEDHPCPVLAVADDGPGISPEDQSRLFERFFRGQVGRKSGAPGTGLGLSICKKIVDLHGGQIAVESQPGVGSTFTVWLPGAPE